MKNKKNIARTFLLCLMGIVIGISVYHWNARTLTNNQMPMPFGIGASVVLSGSMEPELSVDDLVVVRKTDSVQVGDVVVFQSAGTLVIHRVKQIDGDVIITKGDANDTCDDPISITSIKGVMVFSVPGAGVVVDILRQPLVIVMLLVLAFGLMELSYRKEKKSDTDEMEDIKSEIRSLLDELKEEQEK